MKKINLFVLTFIFTLLVFAQNTKMKQIIYNDDLVDNAIENLLEDKYSSSLILSDRTLGLIATINGNSYYVNRVADAGNFQLKLIDVETGQLVSSLPYFTMNDITLDATGNYYIINLPNGETLEIPLWMNSSNISQILENYSGTPIYFNGELIGVTLFLTNSIQLSIYQPVYGVYSVSFKNLENKLFENMKLDLYFNNKETEDLKKKNLKKKKENKKGKK